MLVVGGDFQESASERYLNRIAIWDGNSFQPLGNGLDHTVYHLTVYNGKLIEGCNFWDGSSWQPLGGGVDGGVYAYTVYNGKLIAGGGFLRAGGVDVNNIAAWDGNSWQPLGSGKITYDYDSLGQLTSLINQDGFQIDYFYQPDGQKQAITVFEPGTAKNVAYCVKYYFDTAGRLTSVTEPLKGYNSQYVAGFDYDDNGNRSGLDYYLNGSLNGNKARVNYTYNNDNLLTDYNTSASGVTAPTFKLENTTIDGLGRLKSAAETLTKPDNSTIAHSLTFGYDSLSQLTSANIGNIGGSTWTAGFNYEDNGDMDQKTVNSEQPTVYTYNGNEMATAGPNSLSYDLNGNMITDPNSATFVYNYDNKLRSASKGSETISLKYDPSGNRIQKSSSVAGNRKYIVDVVGDLPVILLELEATGYTDYTVKKAYIYANSQILAQYDSANNKHFYLHDRLGSVRQLINTSGAVVKLYTYNPFGETIEEQGSVDNDFKYTGQFYDKETGQYYLRARQYSPYLARFTGRDLIMGSFDDPMSLHKYLYCQNDPINNFDLNGRWTEKIHREFGELGSGEKGSLFDYGRLDEVFPADDVLGLLFHPEWNKAHFLSREEVLPNIVGSIIYGIGIGFEYSMHMWQDSYVHHDKDYTWIHPPSGVDEKKGNEEAYKRCDATTKSLERLWKKFNEKGGEYASDKFSEFTKFSVLMEDLWYERDENGKHIMDY